MLLTALVATVPYAEALQRLQTFGRLRQITMKRRDFIIKTSGVAAGSLSYSGLYAQVQKQIEPTVDQKNYDVIVLGVGSMGSSACYHLAKRGFKVLGLEQFDIPHELGSHAGQSRIIRKAKVLIMYRCWKRPIKTGRRWNQKQARKFTIKPDWRILVHKTTRF